MAHKLSKITLVILSATAAGLSTQATAQEAEPQNTQDVEVIEVSGIRESLTTALAEKRSSDNLVEIIQAEDIGKLPDQNLAEVLENVTGIQINRTAGVGTGVQIRGTDANRVEINGVSTVGSGAGRGGISFEDIPASLISAVEVTKAPEAKTIEGSVGGTINLRTLRPLQLSEQIAAIRVQGEYSDLSADEDVMPRLSGTFGDNWETDFGKFGAVFSASYVEQDVTAFLPRVDRDGLVLPDDTGPHVLDDPYLRVQFLNQDYDNIEYETKNVAASFEWAPTQNSKLWLDTIYNDQQRSQESYRVQLSGVAETAEFANITSFETVNLGTLDTENGVRNLGTVLAATAGVMDYDPNNPRGDANMRLSTDTGSRVTESTITRFGGEWYGETFKISSEVSYSDADSSNPDFSTTLDFINPRTAQPDELESVDNAVPTAFDLTSGALTFGLLEGSAYTPSQAELLDPANYALRDVNIGQDVTKNEETAFRVDFTYYVDWDVITAIDVGYRYNKTSSFNQDQGQSTRLRNYPEHANRPTGDLFADVLVAGPTNFNDADDRELYIRDFLLVNPELSFTDSDAVLSAFNNAITAANAASGDSIPLIGTPDVEQLSLFDIDETTDALYAQATFEYGFFRGNFGVRYIDTTIESTGNASLNGDIVSVTTTGDYDYWLPRINVVAEPYDDVLVRSGWGKDINRASFDNLSTSTTFPGSSNDAVERGNPDLLPEEVTSFDISVEWYFAPASVLSVGYFHKDRTNLFTQITQEPAANIVDGQVNRDTTDPCEDGGVFNPVADYGVNAPGEGNGICVPFRSTFNGTGSTTQSGFEFAFQSDLSMFEKTLGWASGFGVIANYTIQDFESGDDFLNVDGGSRDIFNQLDPYVDADLSNLTQRNILRNFSENAYNITIFYEKYGLSARARYTWRDAFRSSDDDFFGLDIVQEARGQLNMSVNYDINEQLNVGLEVINATQSDAEQSCINEGALLCFQDLTDRRILAGVNYRF